MKPIGIVSFVLTVLLSSTLAAQDAKTPAVAIGTKGKVTISVPLPDDAASFKVEGRIRNTNTRRTYGTFGEVDVRGKLFEKAMTLPAGSYLLSLAIRKADGPVVDYEVPFNVPE